MYAEWLIIGLKKIFVRIVRFVLQISFCLQAQPFVNLDTSVRIFFVQKYSTSSVGGYYIEVEIKSKIAQAFFMLK